MEAQDENYSGDQYNETGDAPLANEGGPVNAAIGGPLPSDAKQSPNAVISDTGTTEVNDGTRTESGPQDDYAAVPDGPKAQYEADFGVGDRVSVAVANQQQEGTVKGATFGEDQKVVSYKIALDGAKFNPMDPAHHGNGEFDHGDFAASLVCKA